MMILYRFLQPLLVSCFGAVAMILKHTPGLREKTRKLWLTRDMRYIEGVPAFKKLDLSLLKNVRPIWIHAASGEFEYAKPVIRELQQKHPNTPILVTYFSPTYAENVRKFPGVTLSCPLPLDSSGEIKEFLDLLNPRALLIARTDAWPNTVRLTRTHGIPILLFSTTFHEESRRMSIFGRALTRATFREIGTIQCVSPDDKATLVAIGAPRVEICGDTRYDQVLARLQSARPMATVAMMAALKESIHPRALIAGSIWREDLEPILHASTETRAQTPHTLILVPHEISENFLKEIEETCFAFGFTKEKVARFSRLSNGRHPLSVVIVDSVGMLAELYLLGDIAFVGGSFRKTVHSVMEPLAAGCLTLVGPLHTNNREAIEFQSIQDHSISFVGAACTSADLAALLATRWEASKHHDFKSRLRFEIMKRGGATAHVLSWLKPQLELQ